MKAVRFMASGLNKSPFLYLHLFHETIETLTEHIHGKQNLSQDAIEILIDSLTKYSLIVPVPIPLYSGTVLSRAVKYLENDGGCCYDNPSRLSYISENASIVIAKGRLNKQGKSLFYGCLNADSNSIGAILAEIRAKKGDVINILQCRTKLEHTSEQNEDPLRVLPIGISDYCRRGVPGPFQLHETFKQIYGLLNANLHPTAMLAIQLRDAFLMQILKSNESSSLYDVTSLIGAEFLKHKEIDGILYPSTKFDGFPSVALKPTSVDKKLRYETVLAVRVDECFGYGMFEATVLKQGIKDSGSIRWSKDFAFRPCGQ
jgi:hypothetical protein